MIPAACALFLLLAILVVSWLRWEHLPRHRENCETNRRFARASKK